MCCVEGGWFGDEGRLLLHEYARGANRARSGAWALWISGSGDEAQKLLSNQNENPVRRHGAGSEAKETRLIFQCGFVNEEYRREGFFIRGRHLYLLLHLRRQSRGSPAD